MAAPAADSWTTCATRRGRRRLDFLQRIAKVGDVLERAIHGGEADVADGVELVQFLHHHLADLPRRDLALAERQDLLDDAVDGGVDVIGGDRPLVQCALEARADLLGVEVGTVAVGLHHLRQPQLDGLVGGEPLLAGDAAAAAADGVAGLGDARIDDLRIDAAAERTLHRRAARFSGRPGSGPSARPRPCAPWRSPSRPAARRARRRSGAPAPRIRFR